MEQAAFAAEFTPARSILFEKPKVDLGLPESVASVEDVWLASTTAKTGVTGRNPSLVYLIQDAHTNESGQINLARTVDHLLQKHQDLQYVFVEAGAGDDSLSFLKQRAPLARRERVAADYLRRGVLHGEEYLNLTSDRHFTIWGVEDFDLYQKAVDSYRQVAEGREKFRAYHSRIQAAIDALKPRIFSPGLLAFDTKHQRFIDEEIPLTDYFEILTKEAVKRGVPLEDFPHLAALGRLKDRESRIDFARAGEEQQAAVTTLTPEDRQELTEYAGEESPFKLGSRDRREDRAFYTLLEKKLAHRARRYPELAKYFAYLKKAKALNPGKILEEQKRAENRLFDILAGSSDERMLVRSQRQLRHLRKLFDLRITPEEYADYRETARGFSIRHLTGFLNKKIMDMRSLYDRTVFLEEGYDPIVRSAETFYELTRDRDEAFIKTLVQKMDGEDQRKAVLIAGGFHAVNLKALFKQQNISFVSIVPQVYQATDQGRYERLLLNQTISAAAAAVSSASAWKASPMQHAARLAALMNNPVDGPQLIADLGPSDQAAQAVSAGARLAAIAEPDRRRPEGYPQPSLTDPPTYTSPSVLRNSILNKESRRYADPELSELDDAERARWIAEIRAYTLSIAPWFKSFGPDGLPTNPIRTGLKGRGRWGRHGFNVTEDGLVFRYNAAGQLELLTIDRDDNGGPATPGGISKRGEERAFGVTATRELLEETGVDIDMTRAVKVYEGFNEDWRDTDDAFGYGRAYAVLMSYEESQELILKATSDARAVKWSRVDDNLVLFARQNLMVRNALEKIAKGQLTTRSAEEAARQYPSLTLSTGALDRAYDAFLQGQHRVQKTFDLVAPRAPHGGEHLVVAGIERTLADVRRRRFTPDQIRRLEQLGRYNRAFLDYLGNFLYRGDIQTVQEGAVVAPGIPILRITASDVELALLEDLIENRIGFATNIATKTSRIVEATVGRAVVDFSQRRVQGEASSTASEAAIIGGAVATSSVKAAKQHYLEPNGTMAHFWVQIFGPKREKEAFRALAKYYPNGTTFLIDTYDTLKGAQNAADVILEVLSGIDAPAARAEREGNFAVRLDSGDLAELSKKVRQILDKAGLKHVKIVASDDLDEFKIAELVKRGAKIDFYGVGTKLGTGGKNPVLPLEFKESDGSRYWKVRHKGKVTQYAVTAAGETAHAAYSEEVEELLSPVWRAGRRVRGAEKPWKAHERAVLEMSRLTAGQKKLIGADKIPLEARSNPLSFNPRNDGVLVIDDEKTFKRGGGLPVPGGEEISANGRRILDLVPRDNRFASIDRHRRGSISWASSFKDFQPFTFLTHAMVENWTAEDNGLAPHALFTLAELKEHLQKVGGQMLWPDHGEEEGGDSELDPTMLDKEFQYVVIKGMKSATDSYSAFFDNAGNPTELASKIRERGITRLFVYGLAWDYCVRFTAEDARKLGFEVIVIRDATRAVGFPAGSVEATETSFADKGILTASTQDFIDANQNMGVWPAQQLAEPIAHPDIPAEEQGAALEEDFYHLTMGQALVLEDLHEKSITMDYFYRRAPHESDRAVSAGLKFVIDKLRHFQFTDDDIDYLRSLGRFDKRFLKYLKEFKFTGDIDGLPDGSVAFPREPVLRVRGTAFEVLIVETLLLKYMNYNTLIATEAALKKDADPTRRLVLDAISGAQGPAHRQAAYSAFVGGVDATTDLDAHFLYGLPLAWPGDEGEHLGADFITGGKQAAHGGVYKVAVFDGLDRIKVASPIKTSLPGNKVVMDVLTKAGKVVRRFIGIEDADNAIRVRRGWRTEVVSRPLMRKGEVVAPADSPWQVQAYSRDQRRRYSGVQESQPTPTLLARQRALIREARSAVRGQDDPAGARLAAVTPTKAAFSGRRLDTGFLNLPEDPAMIKVHRKNVLQLNPGYDADKLFGMMQWDPAQYDNPHLPSDVGALQDPDAFSRQQGFRFLNMMIHDPIQGWAIPEELSQFKEVIALAVRHERMINPDIDSYYAYLTVDQKVVQPGQTQRRAGWHGDAFVSSETHVLRGPDGKPVPILTDNTYVISDALPTLFLPGPFSLQEIDREDIPAVLRHFDDLATGKKPLTYSPHHLVRMTPYDLHAVNTNHGDRPVERTFVKIEFSRQRFNMEGNAINPLFEYENWVWVPRDPSRRNNRNQITDWARADQEAFRLIDPAGLDFAAERTDQPWADPEVFYARKMQGVFAERAKAGERVKTVVNGFVVTVNIAGEGDWKITTSQGDRYFLTDEVFRGRYDVGAGEYGYFKPLNRPMRMVQVKEAVRLMSPWGVMQFLPPGSVIADGGPGNVYGIHRDNYRASYRKTDASGTLLDSPPAAAARLAVDIRPYERFVDEVVSKNGFNGFHFWGNQPYMPGRYGILTITGNPVQIAHQNFPQEVMRQANLNGVIIVLAKTHVIKGADLEATLAERLAMMDLAFRDSPNIYLAVSDSGWYVDFVESMKRLVPQAEPYLMFGVDSFRKWLDFSSFSEIRRVLDTAVRVLVNSRSASNQGVFDSVLRDLDHKLPFKSGVSDQIRFVPVEDRAVSSTAVRDRIQSGDAAWGQDVPPQVAALIKERGLYGYHAARLAAAAQASADGQLDLTPFQRFADSVVSSGRQNALRFWNDRKPEGAQRVAVFPITGDPVTDAHAERPSEILNQGEADAVVVVLSKHHTTKGGNLGATTAQRLAMLDGVFADDPYVTVALSDGGWYLDFARSMTRALPDAQIDLFVGIESFESYLRVNTAKDIRDLAGTGTGFMIHGRTGRPESELTAIMAKYADKLPEGFAERVRFVHTAARAESSSDVRAAIAAGDGQWVRWVPLSVRALISRLGLYSETDELHALRETAAAAGLESVNRIPRVPDPAKPVAMLFDVHGVLLEPTWKKEYIYTYMAVTGADAAAASVWVDANTIHVSDEEIIHKIAQVSTKPIAEVRKQRLIAKNFYSQTKSPDLVPGARNLVREAARRGIPIFVSSGTDRALILKQLGEAGYLEFIRPENVIGRDDVLRSTDEGYSFEARNAAIQDLGRRHPQHTFVHFNDWIGGQDAVRRLGGINVSPAQGTGDELRRNRQELTRRGVDYFMAPGFERWEEMLAFFSVADDVQRTDVRAPIAEHEATRIFVTPAVRPEPLRLHIRVSEDLTQLTYSEVLDDAGVRRPDGSTDYSKLRLGEIASFPSSYLLSPENYMKSKLAPDVWARIEPLWSARKRYTEYEGITVAWDANVDRGVWTTNIDTLVFIRTLAHLIRSGDLNAASVRNAVEIGVGGGHLSKYMATVMPHLESITITDISIDALATAKGEVLAALKQRQAAGPVQLFTLLGKGLRALEGGRDLIVINPPYIPSHPDDGRLEQDPYRGTGLIREVLELGVSKLDPNNPDAAIFMNISSLAQRDFQSYTKKFSSRVRVEPVGAPIRVPLKIYSLTGHRDTVSSAWRDWLISEGLLEFDPHARPGEEPYWHTLQLYKIVPVAAGARLSRAREVLDTLSSLVRDLVTPSTSRPLRLAQAQINTVVGDLQGNADRVIAQTSNAMDQGADLVLFPELTIPGYLPQDLLFKDHFVRENRRMLYDVARRLGELSSDRGQDMAAVVGFVDYDDEESLEKDVPDRKIYNALAFIVNGRIRGIYRKKDLPNYGVFDEKRYFASDIDEALVIDYKGIPIGINICEDIWNRVGPYQINAGWGSALQISINASPFHLGKWGTREELLKDRVRETGNHFVYTNLVGAQDGVVFDGTSFIMDPQGRVIQRTPSFTEDLSVTDLRIPVTRVQRLKFEYFKMFNRIQNGLRRMAGLKARRAHLVRARSAWHSPAASKPAVPAQEPALYAERMEALYQTLILGTRDYLTKNGFTHAFIGESGGIDSAVVTAIAAAAIGQKNVTAVSMPSRFNSNATKNDARQVAQNIGVNFFEEPIENEFGVITGDLKRRHAEFAEPTVAEENVQARLRMIRLFFHSNKRAGSIVLTTGNKSETAVGYATLYGDMAGGFGVIQDVWKTDIFALARYINKREGREVIPWSIINRPPSAELRDGQQDTDSLPPYATLDPILAAYIEHNRSAAQIAAAEALNPKLVERVLAMVDRAEFKRRQAAPGVKVTPKAFVADDRRMPVTTRFRETAATGARLTQTPAHPVLSASLPDAAEAGLKIEIKALIGPKNIEALEELFLNMRPAADAAAVGASLIMAIDADARNEAVPLLASRPTTEGAKAGLQIVAVVNDANGRLAQIPIHTIPDAASRRRELRESASAGVESAGSREARGVRAAIRIAEKIRNEVFPADVDYAALEGVVKIDFAQIVRRLEAQDASADEIDTLLFAFLHELKGENGNIYFANLDALDGAVHDLAERIVSDRTAARGRILTVEPPAGTAVTEIVFWDDSIAASSDASPNRTVLYALGLEKGALPDLPTVTRLALLAADFYARHLVDGRLPVEGESGYEDLILDFSQSAFFKTHARFAFGSLPAAKMYDVMRGVEKDVNLLRLVSIRPLLQFLNDRLAAARLALQAAISA